MGADASGTAAVHLSGDWTIAGLPQAQSARYTRLLEGEIRRKDAELRNMRDSMEKRIREESEKRAANEHVMIHQARRAAMGEMLGAIVHQWRQPLNALSMIVQNMKEALEYGEFDGECMEHSVASSMEQISFMSKTVDVFSNFFRPHGSTECFCPKQCVDEVVAMVSGWFTNFTNIRIDIVDELDNEVKVQGCHNEFKQVVLNVLCNARDAILKQPLKSAGHCSGRISIRISHEGGVMSLSALWITAAELMNRSGSASSSRTLLPRKQPMGPA